MRRVKNERIGYYLTSCISLQMPSQLRHADGADDAHSADCRQTKHAELACRRCHLQTTEKEHKRQLYLPCVADLKVPKLRHWQTEDRDVGRYIGRAAYGVKRL